MSGPHDPYARLRIRKWIVRGVALAALVAAGWYLWSSSRPPPELSERIDAIVEEALEEGPIVGASVGVARDGQVVHQAGYGYADLENELPAGAETVYKVGSITKQFTAAAILDLVDEGLIRLDTAVAAYLPETGLPARVTVRSLLNHTAGVRNFTTMERWWASLGVEVTPSELVSVFVDEPLDFEPGSAFSYSNSGYILLGRIVEEVTGRPYGGFLNQRFFVPLGLERTSYCDDRALIPDRARGYQIVDGALAHAAFVSMSQAYAAGGVCSNVPDLLRWTRLLGRGGVVRRERYARMIRPDTLRTGQRIEYGYGLAVGSLDGHRRIGHVGGMRGFANYLAHYPDDDLTVVVLTNTEGAAAAALESRIARMLLGLNETAVRDIPLTPEEIQAYTGTYDMRLTEVTLTEREGRLHAVIPDPGIDDTDLLYQGGSEFVAAGDPATRVRFEMVDGRAEGFVLEHQGITLEGERIGN